MLGFYVSPILVLCVCLNPHWPMPLRINCIFHTFIYSLCLPLFKKTSTEYLLCSMFCIYIFKIVCILFINLRSFKNILLCLVLLQSNNLLSGILQVFQSYRWGEGWGISFLLIKGYELCPHTIQKDKNPSFPIRYLNLRRGR